MDDTGNSPVIIIISAIGDIRSWFHSAVDCRVIHIHARSSRTYLTNQLLGKLTCLDVVHRSLTTTLSQYCCFVLTEEAYSHSGLRTRELGQISYG